MATRVRAVIGGLTIMQQHGAQEGELVLGDIKRRTRRTDGWSEVEHIMTVGHRYGSSNELIWARPICGGDAGRVGSGSSGMKLCRRCEKKAEGTAS